MAPTLSQIHVGDLKCQSDTYCKEFETTCIACSEKPDKKGFYKVKLHDTILFPEGGGQPFDTGYIDDVRVYDVQRERLEHVHYTKEPVPVGKAVKLKLDWDRRWDNVQQHSGQHLVTAVLEKEPYFLKTVSWGQNATRCYVDLDTNKHKMPEDLNAVERHINEMIVKALPVVVYRKSYNDENRPERLPDDYVGGGTIRTVNIVGLDDMNTCCGTHVAHTGHLQCVKLLHYEKVRGGNTRLYFVVGQRVMNSFDAIYKTSRQITSLLSVQPESFVESITKVQKQAKASQKQVKQLSTELAGYIAKDIAAELKERQVVLEYRPDADQELLSQIALLLSENTALKGQDKAVVLMCGEKSAGGSLIVQGFSNTLLQQVVTVIKATLNVRGGGKDRWQGKATSWQGLEELEKQMNNLSL